MSIAGQQLIGQILIHPPAQVVGEVALGEEGFEGEQCGHSGVPALTTVVPGKISCTSVTA